MSFGLGSMILMLAELMMKVDMTIAMGIMTTKKTMTSMRRKVDPCAMIFLRFSQWFRAGILILACLLTACAEKTSPPMELPPAPTFDYSLLLRSTAPPVTPLPTITPGGKATISFSRDIQPIFNENCVRCHGGIANLWLTDYEQMLLGALNGPVVRPNNPDQSPLYTYVRDGLMPVDADDLHQEQIELIRRWIEEGAVKN